MVRNSQIQKESPLIFTASVIVCVDGGANRLCEIIKENQNLPHKVSQAGRLLWYLQTTRLLELLIYVSSSRFRMLSLGISTH
jgi:hypothetical protein